MFLMSIQMRLMAVHKRIICLLTYCAEESFLEIVLLIIILSGYIQN